MIALTGYVIGLAFGVFVGWLLFHDQGSSQHKSAVPVARINQACGKTDLESFEYQHGVIVVTCAGRYLGDEWTVVLQP